MQVFRIYFKVMRSSKFYIALSVFVFMTISIIFSFLGQSAEPTGFEGVKIPIAFINQDADTPLSQGLKTYLAESGCVFFEEDKEEALQDALFYRQISYVAILPAGFSAAFMEGENPSIQKVLMPNSTAAYYVDMAINKFLNTARFRIDYGQGQGVEEIMQATLDDLALQTRVILQAGDGSSTIEPAYSYYFKNCAYGLLAMIIAGVSAVMIAFNDRDLYLRNLCGPLSKRKTNWQLFMGHGLYSLGCWLFLMLAGLVLHGQELLGSGRLWVYLLNTLVFAMASTSIAFAVGGTVKTYNGLAGAMNVISLGMNMLGGVWVPQAVMKKSMLAVARFLPTYWFVKANDTLLNMAVLNLKTLTPVFKSILIQFGFALAIFTVALYLSKEKRRSHFA